MANWKWCALVLVISCVAVLGQSEEPATSPVKSHSEKQRILADEKDSNLVPSKKTFNHSSRTTTSASETIIPGSETNTTAPETTTPTPKITSPTPKTTPSTPKTTPSTPKTTPSTPEMTPSTPKTTPSTPKTSTSTTAPTPAPAPSPILPPKTGVWNVTDSKTNITCIVVQFAVQFNISYVAGKNTQNATFNLPEDSVRTGGSCSNTSQYITLSWPQIDAKNQNNFTLKFDMNATSHQYYVSKVNLSLVYNANIFPNASSTENMELSSTGKEWMAGLNYSYRCKREQILKLTSADQGGESGNLAAKVMVSNVQEEAFRSEKGHQFSIAMDCDGGDVPDMVPVAVGCTLGALVLVVLAAYLFGRRRSPAHGYVSM